MSDTIYWKLLAGYLANECSKKEKEKVEEWLISDPKNQKIMKFLKVIWESQEIQPKKSNVKKIWNELAEQAGIAPVSIDTNMEKPTMSISRGKRFSFHIPPFYNRILRYAAVLFIAILLPFLIWKAVNPSEFKEIFVENGKQMNLTLSDGTRVTLDSESIFKYPLKLNRKTRKVILSGEGYFEVSANTKKAFIIHANNAVIKVLGTKFNVRAWPHNWRVKVAVAEGCVSLRPEKNGADTQVIISKGQSSTLSYKEKPSEPQKVDIKQHLGWLNHEAHFENIALHEILYQLERWYNLRFTLEDPSLASERLTVHIQNKPLKDNLELIATLLDLEYTRTGQIVHFGQKKLQ